MELSSIVHTEPENLVDYQADLLISTLSHDLRSLEIVKKFENLKCRKIALCSAGQSRDHAFRSHRRYFRENDFETIAVKSKLLPVEELLKGFDKPELNLVFDCTAMSQEWYYEFFRWFSESQERFKKVGVRFTYSLSCYADEYVARKVKEIRTFLEVRERKEKKALILGLGHEKNVSDAIARIEKHDLIYLFYADPAIDKRFVEEVFVNNHALINAVPIRNLHAYSIYNGQEIYQKLINIILPLRDEYDVTLIPHGPKIFSVASMLVHLGYPDTRISYPVLAKSHIPGRIPCGKPVVLDVCFEGEE